MQASSLSFILIGVCLFVPLDCTARPQDPEPRSRPRRTAAVGPRSSLGFSREGAPRPLLMVLKTGASSFLCTDSKGRLYRSKLKNGEDCLSQRVWVGVAAPYQVFYSVSGGQLLKPGRGGLRPTGQPGAASALWERFLAKRRRRRHEVNPSDPLRSQSHPSHSGKEPAGSDHRPPEQDQAGAVSKETINSCDDPLRVLQSNGPVSPVKTNIADRPDQD